MTSRSEDITECRDWTVSRSSRTVLSTCSTANCMAERPRSSCACCPVHGHETEAFHECGGKYSSLQTARAFLKDAPILLLDEATSALDIDSEEAIREALGRLMQERTVIAIAHRLSTLRSFDRIVVLQEGRLHEDGPPDTLMRRKGLYRELVMREMNRLSKQAA